MARKIREGEQASGDFVIASLENEMKWKWKKTVRKPSPLMFKNLIGGKVPLICIEYLLRIHIYICMHIYIHIYTYIHELT